MYSEAELESAVTAGTLTREAADALRSHVAATRQVPLADEEQFRLVTGFNDIFVTIAGILVLVGAGWIGASVLGALGGAAVAAAAWGMSEYFTRVRRMALPSIVFFLAFVGGVYVFVTFGILQSFLGFEWMRAWYFSGNSREFLLAQVAGAAIVVGACWLHWKRFMVPITIAAGVAAIARFAFTLVMALAWPNVGQWTLLLVLAAGVAVFVYAMHWDTQDRARKTRKSDVAFWLHLAASPMIVHPLFVLMGMNLGLNDSGSGGEANAVIIAVAAIAIYVALGVIALIVDRRAILVSALAYVLAAAIYLAYKIGSTEVSFAFAIIIIGGSLLMLSAFWQTMRRALLPLVPETLRERVPLPA